MGLNRSTPKDPSVLFTLILVMLVTVSASYGQDTLTRSRTDSTTETSSSVTVQETQATRTEEPTGSDEPAATEQPNGFEETSQETTTSPEPPLTGSTDTQSAPEFNRDSESFKESAPFDEPREDLARPSLEPEEGSELLGTPHLQDTYQEQSVENREGISRDGKPEYPPEVTSSRTDPPQEEAKETPLSEEESHEYIAEPDRLPESPEESIHEADAPLESIEPDDLDRQDLQDLGITAEEFEALQETAERIEEISDSMPMAAPSIEGESGRHEAPPTPPGPQLEITITNETTEIATAKDILEQSPELLNFTDGSYSPEVNITTRLYDIEYKNKSITKTSFTYSVLAPSGGIADFELVIEVPKEVARQVKDMKFEVPPTEIIKDDPVVKWALKNVPQGKAARYTFTVKGDVQNFETLALAAGEQPSILKRFLAWITSLFGA